MSHETLKVRNPRLKRKRGHYKYERVLHKDDE